MSTARLFQERGFGLIKSDSRSLGKPPAAFPGRVATDADLAIAVDRQQTKLATALSATATAMNLVSVASIVPWCLLTIDDEIVQVTGAATGNTVPITRGFDGTLPAVHLAGATVAGLIDAFHHNTLVAEVEAIETALGVNLSKVLSSSAFLVSTDYVFTPIVSGAGVTVPGGNLIAGANVLTFAQIPNGVNGSDVDHYLWISGGTGTAEGAKITGGSGVAGQPGQLIVTCAFAHTGAWSVASASNGIAEACVVARGRGGASIYVPGGTHEMRAPVRIFGYTRLFGVGMYNTILHRTGNYGNTFIIGYPTGGDNCITFEDLFFSFDVGTFSAGPPPSITNKPTTGSHVLVQGGNTIAFNRCRVQDMPIGINIIGGSQIMVDDCVFQGLWSPAYASCQVTAADIQIANDAVLGIATYIKIRGCALIGGRRGPANEVWGAQFRLWVRGCEDLEILGGAIAAAAVNNIQIIPTSAGGICGQIRITAGVRFDGATNTDVFIAGDGTASAANVSVIGCQFNGQALGSGIAYGDCAFQVAPVPSGVQGAVGVVFSDNVVFNYYHCPVLIFDAFQWEISDNMIYLYNVGVAASSAQASGIFVGGRANNGLIQGNQVGGDNSGVNAYGVGNNHCLFGITVGDPTGVEAGVTVVDNFPPFPTAIGTATDQIFNTLLTRTFFIATENGANNAIAGALPNVPLLRGLRVSMIIAHSLQAAGVNTFNLNGTGAKPIRSSYNPNNNIATAYVVNALINLQYDGAEWLDLSQ